MIEEKKEKLLLHSCCGPCSTAVIDRLKNDYDITIFYYNPNIYPEEEYIKRRDEEIRYCKESGLNILVIDGGYGDANEWYDVVKGLENEKEGGKRCEVCFKMRLMKTAKMCKDLGLNIFATTLSVSPHKNAKVINDMGNLASEKYKVKYLESDFKKKDGYLISIKKSKEFNLYRQNYCGCKFSLNRKVEE